MGPQLTLAAGAYFVGTTDRTRPRRRWGCSLRALFFMVTVLCVALGYKVHQVQRQREAVRALAAEKVILLWDYQLAGRTDPPGPEWLRQLLGDDFFAHVGMIGFVVPMWGVPTSDKVDDDLLANLRSLRLVERIRLDDCDQITDRGLASVGTLGRLTELNLSNTHVTDVGIAKLAPLRRLERLTLDETAITDQSVPHLAQLTNLKELYIWGTQISGEGVARLRKLLPDCYIEAP